MYQIQDFSIKTGVSKRMLRYLEEQDLLVPDRGENEYRLYAEHHLESLRMIQFWQSLGFSLREIKSLQSVSATELEARLEQLRETQKEDLEKQVEQLELVRRVLAKVRARDEGDGASLSRELASLHVWNRSARDQFLESFQARERIIYGSYPELDALSGSLVETLKNLGISAFTESVDFLRYDGCCSELPSGDTVLWESVTEYMYWFAHLPENLLMSKMADGPIEESLREALQAALSRNFYPLTLEPSGRLFHSSSIRQYVGAFDICVRFTLSMSQPEALEPMKAFLILPFQFFQACRRGLNADSSKLSRALRQTVVRLKEEDIAEKTRNISNEDYLLTILLADAETRGRLFESLSEHGRDAVLDDLRALTQKLESTWAGLRG